MLNDIHGSLLEGMRVALKRLLMSLEGENLVMDGYEVS